MAVSISIKVVSSMQSPKVKDLLGVESRKDFKKVSKILGNPIAKSAKSIKNTYSTKVLVVTANDVVTEADVLAASQINMVGTLIDYLDSINDVNVEVKVNNFHRVVRQEKKALSDEYGGTAIPADRYKQYLNKCRAAEVTWWKSQVIVTKSSDTQFDGAELDSETGKWHATAKTKTVFTQFPVTEEVLIGAGLIKQEVRKDNDGKEYTVNVGLCSGDKLTLKSKVRSTSGKVYLQEVVNQFGEKILILRRQDPN